MFHVAASADSRVAGHVGDLHDPAFACGEQLKRTLGLNLTLALGQLVLTATPMSLVT